MRRILVLMPLMALGAAPPAPQPASPKAPTLVSPAYPDCRTLHVANSEREGVFRRLGDLPPAEAYHAVLRAGPDGCPDPLLVSERVNWPRRSPAKPAP